MKFNRKARVASGLIITGLSLLGTDKLIDYDTSRAISIAERLEECAEPVKEVAGSLSCRSVLEASVTAVETIEPNGNRAYTYRPNDILAEARSIRDGTERSFIDDMTLLAVGAAGLVVTGFSVTLGYRSDNEALEPKQPQALVI
jgi:hypothetical protein